MTAEESSDTDRGDWRDLKGVEEEEEGPDKRDTMTPDYK